MNNYPGKARIGVIAILGVAALVIVGLSRSSGRAYSATSTPATDTPALYVTDDDSEAITAYTAASNGDVSPLAPMPTGLSEPQFTVVDASGKIYATNPITMSVTIYAKGSNGDTAPLATIGGSNTGLDYPEGIALDSSQNIYVTNCPACSSESGNPSVTVYPPLGGSTGELNEGPIATISGSNTGLMSPEGIAVDSTSGDIFVADSGAASVFGYSPLSPGCTSGSPCAINADPTSDISGDNTGLMTPKGIAEHTGGKIYVADSTADSVFVYSSDIGR